MEAKFSDTFEYAIANENSQVFDLLVKDFDNCSDEERNKIPECTVIDNIVRKATMKEVLTGNRSSISEIENYCQKKKFERPRGP